MGLNITKIRSNILNHLQDNRKFFLKDSAVKLSCLMKKGKIKNLIFLNYVPELEKFLFWCQQLIAESLGKKNNGFLPVISNNPKDHHSLLQLYLDGAKDKLFHIFSSEIKINQKVKINKNLKIKHFLKNKNLNLIKNSQKNALIKVFKDKKIPFREFKIKSIDENTIGNLYSYFILETVIIGKMININPFDQPAVEQVKNLTKKLLR